MTTFFIFILIMLIVCLKDFKAAIKARQVKLIVFYSLSFGISLAIAALHCLGSF